MMNPETLEFQPTTSSVPKGWLVFNVGDTLTIKDMVFRIRKITKKDIIIRPVK